MARRVLVDSNIFLDYYLDRRDNVLPLGEFAFQFVQRALKCEFFVLVCDLALREIEKIAGISQEHIWGVILSELKKKQKVLVVWGNAELAIKAAKISAERNLPLNDCVFALIAKENNAIVVSRDKHFQYLHDIVETKKPEEL